MDVIAPTLTEINELRESLVEDIHVTPVQRCPAIEARLGPGTCIWGKFEFLQRTGTFKARGALAVVRNARILRKAQLLAGDYRRQRRQPRDCGGICRSEQPARVPGW